MERKTIESNICQAITIVNEVISLLNEINIPCLKPERTYLEKCNSSQLVELQMKSDADIIDSNDRMKFYCQEINPLDRILERVFKTIDILIKTNRLARAAQSREKKAMEVMIDMKQTISNQASMIADWRNNVIIKADASTSCEDLVNPLQLDIQNKQSVIEQLSTDLEASLALQQSHAKELTQCNTTLRKMKTALRETKLIISAQRTEINRLVTDRIMLSSHTINAIDEYYDNFSMGKIDREEYVLRSDNRADMSGKPPLPKPHTSSDQTDFDSAMTTEDPSSHQLHSEFSQRLEILSDNQRYSLETDSKDGSSSRMRTSVQDTKLSDIIRDSDSDIAYSTKIHKDQHILATHDDTYDYGEQPHQLEGKGSTILTTRRSQEGRYDSLKPKQSDQEPNVLAMNKRLVSTTKYENFNSLERRPSDFEENFRYKNTDMTPSGDILVRSSVSDDYEYDDYDGIHGRDNDYDNNFHEDDEDDSRTSEDIHDSDFNWQEQVDDVNDSFTMIQRYYDNEGTDNS